MGTLLKLTKYNDQKVQKKKQIILERSMRKRIPYMVNNNTTHRLNSIHLYILQYILTKPVRPIG